MQAISDLKPQVMYLFKGMRGTVRYSGRDKKIGKLMVAKQGIGE